MLCLIQHLLQSVISTKLKATASRRTPKTNHSTPNMYKLKLCLRYLRTRMLLAFTVLCIMIGVAVMIVVNGVMAGFSHEMRDRMHGVLSDVTLEAWSASGFPDAQLHMERIRKVCGDKIASMTPLCQSQGLVSFQIGQEWIHQPVYMQI